MKILLCTDRYYPAISGVVTSVMTLKKYLEAAGHETRILTLSDTIASHVSGDIVYIGSFDAEKIYPDVRIKHPVNKAYLDSLIQWSPDIIHCHTEFSTFFLAKHIYRACRCPMVLTYHTDYEDYVHYVALSRKFGRKLVMHYIRYVCKYMTRVISPTQKTAEILRNYNIPSPIRIIPTGLDLERFTPVRKDEELDRIRHLHGIKKDVPTLIYVGRLGKEKNLTEIVDFLSRYEEKNFQFIIVGDGPDRAEIEAHVRNSRIAAKTIFTGMIRQEEIGIYYQLGNLFLSASTSETQGLTYIEAMASGTPLLCRRDKCLDGVVEDGENGFLFESGDEFCSKIEYFFSHREEWPSLKKKAQDKVIEKFGAVKFASDMHSLYEEAIRDFRPYKPSLLHFLYIKFAETLPWV